MVLEGMDKLLVENLQLKLENFKMKEAQVVQGLRAEKNRLDAERARVNVLLESGFGVGLDQVKRDEAGEWTINVDDPSEGKSE